MSRLIVVCGATAAGKSAVAVKLSQHFRCPILSADSRQFYRQMSIGTAVPTAAELASAEHYFVQDRSVEQPLSAGGYEHEALAKLSEIFKIHNTAILVGGSGLYIDALLYGFDPLPFSADVRAELNAIYERDGLEPILQGLLIADPAYYHIVDRSNPARVIRALEVCRTSGMPYSNLRTGRRVEREFAVVKVAIDMPRAELYERINNRVDRMIKDGLQHEARQVEQYKHLAPLKTVGYNEFFDFFDNKITLDRAIELIKQNTRNYAKRQLTWLRKDRLLHYFLPDDLTSIINYIDGNN